MRPKSVVASGLAGLGLLVLFQGYAFLPGRPGAAEEPPLVRIEAARVEYRSPGEFRSGGTPVNGPLVGIAAERPFEIMQRQVTRGEYQACVAAAACRPLAGPGEPELPLVGVSWLDAADYAAWLSRETGRSYRLPSDREWALAAGSRYRDDVYTEVSDPADPAKRWLASYEAMAADREPLESRPRPVGGFGRNEHGLLDLAGNVWEWTSTCFVRFRSDPETGAVSAHENCGVRIAQGRHRAYMTDFIRDPKAGACSVGVPPANLGLRLVREASGPLGRLRARLGA
ncbi:MAG: SUMF1/EgtB/PvdO family nonheme iron enzyme [Tistlia sp.]|uniref:SUMF1/EgtB/PvdO family nonheme iron enzyme n=1 Tax=Tistlia sp. TaxID=3057121 RepID=UPI0034A53796